MEDTSMWRFEHNIQVTMYVVSSKYSNNSEANASESIENIENILLIIKCGSWINHHL